MFCEEMLQLFQKIPFALPKTAGYIKKQHTLQADTGGKWFLGKQKSNLPPMKRPILIKVLNKKEDDIK